MAETDYKATLKLPKTDFPMKANLPKREPDLLKRWNETNLYARILEARASAQSWILHDGPPYANGRVHMGTALNKALKDFVVRSRSMMGFRTPYVPGWDCHGMPIEFKVSRDLGEKARTLSKLELRRLCRVEAEKWIDIQRADFMRLGCVGDWYRPYITMDPEYDAAEIGVLRKLTAAGYVYRGLRPVHWCFSDRTALAEAEVEYREHKSPSIYVAFAFNDAAGDAAELAANPADGTELEEARRAGKLFAVIWTTTPWTLPANLGISLNPTFEYVALKAGDSYYVVAERLAEAVAKECGLTVEKTIALDSAALRARDGRDIFRHPFAGRDVKLMYGDHVTAEAGTGLVHTAPGHGYEDFVVGNQYGLQPFTPVDRTGTFTAEAGEWAGQNVFKANPAIVAKLREIGALLHAHDYTHSYPHCWRCKNPLIFLAAEQWFLRIDHDRLRERVIAEIDAVKWIPAWSRDRIRNMTETRPDWCLSRQRAWGVPIAVFVHRASGEPLRDPAVMANIVAIFAKEGADAWYASPPERFLGKKYDPADYEQVKDIVDVWFESGSTHAFVLEARGLPWPADLYLEGSDQHRGWFHSSLLESVGTRGRAPFRALLTHGFVLDEQGRKMSKSLGNVTAPQEVMREYGADILRLWVMMSDTTEDLRIGREILKQQAELYRRLRNTLRWLLGCLDGFSEAERVEYREMPELERYILHRVTELDARIRRAVETYDWTGVYPEIHNFCANDLSAFYFDIRKDSLYCDRPDSPRRRAARTVLDHLHRALCTWLAPVLCFTAEEAWGARFGEEASVHLQVFPEMPAAWRDEELAEKWDKIRTIRRKITIATEVARSSGFINSSLDEMVTLPLAPQDLDLLDNAGWAEVAVVSVVEVQRDNRTDAVSGGRNTLSDPRALPVRGIRAPGQKCARCWKVLEEVGENPKHKQLCRRCVDAVESGLVCQAAE